MANKKQKIPRKIPAITSVVQCTERYILLNTTAGKIIVDIIKKRTFENLFFIIGVNNKKDDIRKIVEIVACPLGKLKPISCREKLSGRILPVRFLINSGSTVPSDVAIVKM